VYSFNMKSNIYKYYLYSSFSNFLFFLPIIIVFFQDNGLSLTQIFVIEAIFSLGLVLFEIPTGAFADNFGKRKSLILGGIVWIFSLLIFAFSRSFYNFVFAYLLFALGSALISGADTALFYDILGDRVEHKKFKKYQGNAKMIGLITISVTSLFGGYIASFSMRYTFIASAIAMSFMLLVLCSINHKEVKKSKRQAYFDIVKISFSIIKKSRLLLWLFVYSSVFMLVFKLTQPSMQIYMNLASLDIEYFGFASSFFFLVGAIASKLTYFFEKSFKKYSYFVSGILLVIPIFVLSQFVFKSGFLTFGIVFFSISINSIFVQHDILMNSPQSKHSTILSFNNFFDRLSMVAISPIFGFLMDRIGVKDMFLYTSIFAMIIVSIMAIFYFRFVKFQC